MSLPQAFSLGFEGRSASREVCDSEPVWLICTPPRPSAGAAAVQLTCVSHLKPCLRHHYIYIYSYNLFNKLSFPTSEAPWFQKPLYVPPGPNVTVLE